MIKLFIFLFGLTATTQAFAVGSIIVAAVVSSAFAATAAGVAIAMAINMVIAAVVSKAFFSPSQPDMGGIGGGSGSSPNPGNRQQIAPATDNKLPIVYGKAYVGGIITDLSITSNNQDLYYVLSLCEVTNTNPGQTADSISFGDVYFGGKKVLFQSNGYVVRGLMDESTGIIDPTVDGKLAFYFYSNGSYSPTNQSLNAIQVMQAPGLVYTWDNSKLMTNCAFVILKMTYSQTANLRGIEQTKFQVINTRSSTGDCFSDYLTNTRYGGAIPPEQVNYDSLEELTAYSDEIFHYTDYDGIPRTQPRFKFNGALDTSRSIMDNLQDMASCCDCLLTYNEITAKWGVITQKPLYTPAMDINDSNMISAITITPLDIASSYNVVECKFPDKLNQDAFNSSTFDLAQIAPELLAPNEPTNKISLSLPLANNDVQAQYIANRVLKSAREDIQVSVDIGFTGLQLDAGDIVTVTSANYGWVAKPFRLSRVVQTFNDDGSIAVKLSMSEFNSAIYDDVSIIQFQPAPNTGIGAPDFFGILYPPTISNQQRNAPIPSFDVTVKVSSSGITQYAEIWYSAFANPQPDQRILAGVTAVQSSGNPYETNSLIPPTVLANVPFGNWYFFSRMVNSLASSDFSPPSVLVQWRPLTYQYSERFLCVAYADDETGLNFSFDPRNKLFYGLVNTPSGNPPLTPSSYTWYLADPPFNPVLFGKYTHSLNAVVETTENNYLLYTTRGNRKVSLSVGNAIYFGIGGSFVPSENSIYDQTIWEGLEDGNNVIDLDVRTGQNTKYGTSSVSQADGLLNVSNNTSGAMTVALQKFLNFGDGVYSKTFTSQQLTIDVFGRVVGFSNQDQFYFSEYTARTIAGQTTFPFSISQYSMALVFLNGILLAESEYTQSPSGITLNTSPTTGSVFYTMLMRAVASSNYFNPLQIAAVTRVNDSTFIFNVPPVQTLNVGDLLTFDNVGTPNAYPLVSVDYVNRTIVVDTTSHVLPNDVNMIGKPVYLLRQASVAYPPFSRVNIDVNNATSFTPTQFYVKNGFEQLYVNGAQFNEIDYDLKNNTFSGFPAALSGEIDIIVFSANNLSIPCSNMTNTVAYSVADQVVYPFTANPQAMEIYANGVSLVEGITYDYIADTISYSLLNPIPNNNTLLNQQTFANDGAA